MIKIVADDQIPFVADLFSGLGKLVLKPGTDIKRQDLLEANALLVRSTTIVNANLLENTPIEFVGSMTAGLDHIDLSWFKEQSITLSFSAGANAVAVAEYVLHCVALLRKKNLLSDKKTTAGIIGVGHVGSLISDRLKKIGFTVLENDPPREFLEKDFYSTPLESLTNADLICIHTPLTKTGLFATEHLINNAFLKKVKPHAVLLNAGRGAVIDNLALLKHDHLISCLDVWENEPHINLELLEKVTIGTPHIAGYSHLAKLRATILVYKDFLKHFELPNIQRSKKLISAPQKTMINVSDCQTPEEVLLKIYNPGKETENMREFLLKNPNQFEKLRRKYNFRNEFSEIQLTSLNKQLKKLLPLWGFSIDN